MIKKFLFMMALAAFFTSCGGGAGTDENVQDETTSMEATQNEVPMIAIGEFDSKAGEFVDQEIMVEGIVDHVCKHGGKKLFLVSDEGDLHVDSDTRFDEALTGSDIKVKGIVREFRVDEAYCLKMEEDNIQSHKKGETDEDLYEMKMAQIKEYRDSMAAAGVDHLSFYSVEYVSHEVKDVKKEEI
ncbi:MAG: hypothetical protein KQI35_12765 [Bacteroidetes bacterium]|nr:hypothetical protein [Bacteroidota bacterium]